MADVSRFPQGILIDGSLTVARPVGSLVTSGGILYTSTSATVATYVVFSGVLPVVDPGTAAAIPVTGNVGIALAIGAGAETNTLAAPTFLGQFLLLYAAVVGGGTRAITAAAAVNQAGNTVMTFGAAADSIKLEAYRSTVPGVLTWRIASNDGVALS